jgi:hypothetical protein
MSDGREEPLEKISRRANEMAPVAPDPLMTTQMDAKHSRLIFRTNVLALSPLSQYMQSGTGNVIN